ncbi:MAG: hypothetical protein ACTSRZ_13720 [Promethearchaeota archaeon]
MKVLYYGDLVAANYIRQGRIYNSPLLLMLMTKIKKAQKNTKKGFFGGLKLLPLDTFPTQIKEQKESLNHRLDP